MLATVTARLATAGASGRMVLDEVLSFAQREVAGRVELGPGRFDGDGFALDIEFGVSRNFFEFLGLVPVAEFNC